jgi:hypothetical protein
MPTSNADRDSRIADLYKAGIHNREICRRLKCYPPDIYRAIRKANIQTKKASIEIRKQGTYEELRDQLVHRYSIGSSALLLAKEFSLSYSTLRSKLCQWKAVRWSAPVGTIHKVMRGYDWIKSEAKTAQHGWMREHIWRAEKALGRKLRPGEVVHHIDTDTRNNRNSNLLVCSQGYHRWLHAEMGRRYAKEHFGARVP